MKPASRILIIGASHLCRNPRVVKEATSLGHNGFEVTVVSAALRPDFTELDKAISLDAPFHTITGYLDSPFRRLWIRLRIRLAREQIRRFGRETPWALGPASDVMRIARSNPADLVIVHNELPFWAGARLLGEGRKVAGDFEDWYSRNLDAEARSIRPMRSLEQWERVLMRDAEYCTTPSEAMSDAIFAEYKGRRPDVIGNSFPLYPLGVRNPDEYQRIVWFSQTVGPGRGLEEFVDVLGKSMIPYRLSLVGDIQPAYRTNLLNRVTESRRKNVDFVPFISPDKLPEFLSNQDIGLALERTDTLSRDLTVTNKILQYLNAGLAVIATRTRGQDEVAKNAPGGVFQPESPGEVIRLLETWHARPVELQRAKYAARAAAEAHYCWEKEEPRLLELVEHALG